MTRIVIIRHGETDIMRTHLAGRKPGVPLNDLGRKQVEALARRLEKPAAIFTSPVQRARETAAILARPHGLEPEVSDAFAEFEFGDWTGLTFEELRDQKVWQEFNRSRETATAPNGEGMQDVLQRALGGLQPLIDGQFDEKTVVVVSHGDVIRALLVAAAGARIADYWRFTVDAASISELCCRPDGIERIVRMNDCAHLEDFGLEQKSA